MFCEIFANFADMKPAKIFQQYVWLVNTLRQYKRLTLEEINNLWVKNDVIGGSPLNRVSFYRHKDAILNMFGINIDCEQKTYKYYISNPEVINDDSIERWMLSTLTVSTALSDSTSIRGRIILESAPAGEEFLEPVIRAMKNNHRLRMGYQKFKAEGYVKTICPYVLKRFDQRWYLLALNDENEMRIYALDYRMNMMETTGETFEMPQDFSPEEYFAEYFGVYTADIPLAHVVVRAYDWTPNYLRSLPLHHSQRELESGNDYTDFSFDIRPTDDFLHELLHHVDGIEVLEPANVRDRAIEMLENTLKRYKKNV